MSEWMNQRGHLEEIKQAFLESLEFAWILCAISNPYNPWSA